MGDCALVIGGDGNCREAKALEAAGFTLDFATSESDAAEKQESESYCMIVCVSKDGKAGLLALQEANEQLAAANEELAATNEEIAATNEELRVTTEELNKEVEVRRRAEEFAAKLAAIVESSEDAIIGKDLDGIITSWNKGAQRMYGYTEAEMLGRSIFTLVPTELADHDAQLLEKIRQGQPIHHYETQRITKEESTIEVSLSLSPIRDRAGAIAGASTIARDVTDRKRAEESVLESNRRLELVSDVASRLLQTEDPQGLVQSLCENVMEFLDCHVFFNFLVDQNRGCLHLNALAGVSQEAGRSIEWLDYGVAVCGCAALEGRRIVAEDIFNTPDPRTELVKGFGIQAYACHPLLAEGGRVIGTLSFGSRTKTTFKDDELALMRLVADQVSTAMERIRLLNAERRRAEELQAVLDAVPAIVWIAHDPGCSRITGNRAAYQALRMPTDVNSSKTAPEAERPTHFRALKDGKELPVDRLPVQMAAKGEAIKDFELDIAFDDGTVRHLIGDAAPLFDESSEPRGAVAAFVDVTERKEIEQQERELEAHKREFYRRTIFAATDGKLIVAEKCEIDGADCEAIGSWRIPGNDALASARDDVFRLALDSGMEQSRVYEFIGCVVEAGSNAIKHAHGGEASLCRGEDSLIFRIADSGPGIGALALPDVALTRNYSTAGTLGMGYKLMLRFADKVYLSTGPHGTTVAIEMRLQG